MKQLVLQQLAAEPDTLVLCATARLAQHLRERHARLMRPQGHTRWEALRCLTVAQWLASWREAWLLTGHPVATGVLQRALSSAQERLLWERVIHQHLGDTDATRLFDLPALAQTAQEAHQLQTLWQVAPPCAPETEEHQQFQHWRQAFMQRCAQHGWASGHELDARTVLALAGPVPGLPWPQRVVLAGFNRLNPGEQALLHALPATGVELCQLAHAAPPGVQTIYRYPDAAAECHAAAAWAHQRHEHAPAARLAIVVPDLAARREQLHDALEDTLAPWLALPWAAEVQRPFNISLGRALIDHALVGTALALLRRLAEAQPAAAPVRQPPSAWAAWMPEALRSAGWLADQRLSSHAYQQRSALDECLTELASFDAFSGPIPLTEALRRLRQLCRERVFQPETEGRPAIEVLGLLEASGQQFDAVWVMGMDAATWPPPIRPNPLLPAEAQRQVRSPNASADVQLAFARQVHAQISQSAPEVVWSWPHRSGAAELQPSPLLAHGPTMQRMDTVTHRHWTADALSSGTRWLAPLLDDAQAPALAPDADAPGGTALLKAQAICPAWAYYRYRLGARPLEQVPEQLDPRQRGTLLHAALEHLWQALGDATTLHALDDAQAEQVMCAAIAAAWARRDSDSNQAALPPRSKTLETRRLLRLLRGWLALEKMRPQGFAVVATEQRQRIRCQGLNIRLQIDRIDRLDDGQLLIIDYKTSSRVDTQNWADDRLSEPQLPLYATWQASQGERVAGVAFAQVLLRRPGWTGLADAEQRLDGVAGFATALSRKRYPAQRFAQWEDVLQHWQTAIDSVAQEIQSGAAAVRVADEKALAYCEVLPLLRLSERRQQWLQSQRHAA